MNYVLTNDGKLTKIRELSKKAINSLDTKYILVDISTDRKGPIYTITDTIGSYTLENDIEMSVGISYDPIDVPFDDIIDIGSMISIKSYNKWFSIYPLIKELLAFNNFFIESGNISSISNYLMIVQIVLNYGKEEFVLDCDDTDSNIYKTFKKIKMNTKVRKVLRDDEVILFHNNKWSIESFYTIEHSDIKFDKIAIMINNTESIYMLTYQEYLLFHSILEMSVNIKYDVTDEDCIEMGFEKYFETVVEDYAVCISLVTFRDILQGCLFIPQMLLLERGISRYPINISICIETIYHRRLTLHISDKDMEVPRNICLFKIIKKLLKM